MEPTDYWGGEEDMVVTNANDKAFVLAVGWDGAVDMQANVDKPQMATILRQIADSIDPYHLAHPDEPEPRCSQETAGFGPPCSDALCEACSPPHPDDPKGDDRG